MERELLQHLANVTIPDWCNLGDYFKEYYPEQSQARLMDIKVLLDELVHEKKLIRISHPTQYQILASDQDFGQGREFITFDVLHRIKHDVFGKINTAGRSYLAEIIRNEKQDALNESFKKLNEVTIPKNNFIQWCLTGTILLSSIVYTVVATLSYNESKRNITKEERLELLEKLIQNKTTKDSIFQKAVSDSLKMR